MVSIVETSEHAAKSYLSTLAVLQLDSILTGARKVSVKKPKPGNANQKPFERIMIMEYELTGIDDSGREKTNSGESPVLYYRYIQRVE